jgi:cytochrome c biogenesis protein CcdA
MSELHLSGGELQVAVAGAAYAVALAGAARSTWSPCGLSMLSSITPLGERGRGGRFKVTASWFVAGAFLGGATLGALMVGVSLLVAGLELDASTRAGLAAAMALLAALGDLGLLGFRLPLLRRQVNERWLDQFRPWIYGAGFGWQIGAGLTTYVMTVAVFASIVLAALTASPWLAGSIGVAFGAARGLAVLFGARITDGLSLQRVHRRFDRLRRPVWLGVVAVQAGVGILLSALLWIPSLAVAAAAVAATAAAVTRTSLRRLATPG